MADNYLERKMEEHGRPAPRRCNADARLATAFGCEALCHLRVLVVSADYGAVAEAVRVFRAAGCRTAFTAVGDSRRPGTAFAQRCGARCYPCLQADAQTYGRIAADLRYHWGGVDVVAADADTALPEDLKDCPRIGLSDAAAFLDTFRRQ